MSEFGSSSSSSRSSAPSSLPSEIEENQSASSKDTRSTQEFQVVQEPVEVEATQEHAEARRKLKGKSKMVNLEDSPEYSREGSDSSEIESSDEELQAKRVSEVSAVC